MKKTAFTLVELIVVITILAILGTIAFISLNNFSASARDAKRLSDVRSLYTKFTLENVKGTRYSSLVKDVTTSEMQINSEMVVVGQGVPDFEALKERRENFLDPTTNTDYQVGFYEGGLTLASTTDVQGIPNMIQIATFSEEKNEAVVVGNFMTSGVDENDTIGLIKGEDGEILVNDTPTTIPGGTKPDGILINGGGKDGDFTWQDLTLTYDGVSHTIMDRNLGATEVYNGIEKSEVRGDLYQWGNNKPWANTGDIPWITETIPNANQYGPGNYFTDTSEQIRYNPSPYDWAAPQNDNLWGDVTDTPFGSNITARQGPCPNGRHVPASHELTGLFSMWCRYRGGNDEICAVNVINQEKTWISGKNFPDMTIENFKDDLKLTLSSWRRWDMTSAMTSAGGLRAHLWSSSTRSNYADHIVVFTDGALGLWNNGRAHGFNIRCFKN